MSTQPVAALASVSPTVPANATTWGLKPNERRENVTIEDDEQDGHLSIK
jgi:hypothetical protein